MNHSVRPESVLQKNNARLQRGLPPVDLPCTMKVALHRSPTDSLGTPVSLEHLAHEMNSLLDGSLRNLAWAEKSLNRWSGPESNGLDVVQKRLRIAHEAMQDMAELLSRALLPPLPALELFDRPGRMDADIQSIIESLQPFSEEHWVQVEFETTPKASTIRIGALGPVILNGLRNAIEAASTAERPRHVTLAVAVNAQDQLMMLITDNGPGWPTFFQIGQSGKSGGHGLGLKLCQRIILELGGDLRFTNVPFGHGAIMQVTVPLRSLARHD